MARDFSSYTFKRIEAEEEEERRRRRRNQKKRGRWIASFVQTAAYAIARIIGMVLEAAGKQVRGVLSSSFNLAAIPHLLVQLILARAVLLGELMPLGTAYLAAALVYRPNLGWMMLLALAAGVNYSNLPGEIFQMLLIGAIILGTVTSVRTRPERWWVALPFLVLSSHLLVRNGVLIYQGWNLFREFAIIFEAVMAAVMSFIFVVALGRLGKRQTATRTEEAITGAVLGICVLLGISDINLGGWYLSSVIGGLLVLLAAQVGGPGVGAASGAMLGLLPSVTRIVTPYAVGIYALAGLLGGIFRRWGRVGTVLGFALGYLMLTIYITDGVPGRELLINAGSSALLFLLVPPRLLESLGAQVKGGMEREDRETGPVDGRDGYPVWWKSINQRLYHLTNLMSEVSAALEQKSEAHSEDDPLPDLIEDVRQGLCRGCARHDSCWHEEFYSTYRNLLDLIAIIETEVTPDDQAGPDSLRKNCPRCREMTAQLRQGVESFKSRRYWKERYQEGRAIVSNQMRGVAEVLKDALAEMEDRATRQSDLEKEVADEMRRMKIKCRDIQVYRMPNLDLEIHLNRRGCQSPGECALLIAPALSSRLGLRLEPSIKECSWPPAEYCEVCLTPARELTLKVGLALVAKPGSPCSGDNLLTEELSGARYLLALSDGMGGGSRASRISQQTLGLLKHLLEARIDLKQAVHNLNTLLRLRSVEEDFATLDLALINLRNGDTSFIKLGSPPSILKRGRNTRLIIGGAPPVGILDRIEMSESRLKLEPGDTLIMVSDGVLDSHFHAAERDTWLLDLARETDIVDPQEMADYLLLTALAKGKRKPDDMAVMVARVEKSQDKYSGEAN
ncbi:MAG: stage II sporulation protein E [Firmicutes bacterium]|nr:stage II sporulation protein E [Bacillota bacterium]